MDNGSTQTGEWLDPIRELLAQYAHIRYALYKARKKALEELKMTEGDVKALEQKIIQGLRRPEVDDDVCMETEEGGVQVVSTPFFLTQYSREGGFRWKLHYYAPKEEK